MRKRVIIVGGGVSGLLTAFALRKYRGVDVTVLEHRTPGGHFTYGGYKYVKRTDAFVSMLHDLGCVFSTYAANGGMLLKNRVIRYPADFKELDNDYIAGIRTAYWEKTRKADPGRKTYSSLADPYSYRPTRAVRTDFDWMVEKLVEQTDVRQCAFLRQEGDICHTTAGKMRFDYMICTIPLVSIKERVQFYVPTALTTKLSVVELLPRKDPYYRFDYIYTPYTPEQHVHRISSNGHTYFAEVSGDVEQLKLYSDLNFLFTGGWSPIGGKENLRGHLLPLDAAPDWPDNIRPVGRYAQWNHKMTIDAALDEAMLLGKEWFGQDD